MPLPGALIPDRERLDLVEDLVEHMLPYAAGPAEEALFVAAMRHAVAWHVERCPWYQELLEVRRCFPEAIEDLAGLQGLPSLPSRFLRRHEILSIAPHEVRIEVCLRPPLALAPSSASSEPPAAPGRTHLDEWTLECSQRMLERLFGDHGWATPATPVHYLLMGCEPTGSEVFSDTLVERQACGLVPPLSASYVVRPAPDGGHELDLLGAVDRLYQIGIAGEPVRIVGKRDLLEPILRRVAESPMPNPALHEESLVVLGLGATDAPLPRGRRGALKRAAAATLGLPGHRVRDAYTVPEQGLTLIECEHERHHVPTWARAFARHPRTLAPLPPGECGLLALLTPVVTASPALSLLTEELAVVHAADDCPCGRQTDWVDFVGRVPDPVRLVPRPAGGAPSREGGVA